MIILDGQKLANQILSNLKKYTTNANLKPHLAAILIGDNPASLKYVQMKQLSGQKIGIKTSLYQPGKNTNQNSIIDLIKQLNIDKTIDGILVQLPLPPHLDTNLIINTINPAKDVDGLTSTNLGRLFQADRHIPVSASPQAIITILEKYKIHLKGKHVVIINNTSLVGLPLTALFNNRWATVTICHQYTKHLKAITKTADILVSAVGIKHFVTADFIKKGAIVVGLGVCKDKNGKMAGDLDFKALSAKASYLTPNFGGIGPLTIACLFQNLIKLSN